MHKYGTRGPGGLLTRALAAIPGNPTLPYPAEDLFWRLYRSAPGSCAATSPAC
ncbi:MAG: hypothetical protein R3E68_00835 [Burkholderiaceae bacterium]